MRDAVGSHRLRAVDSSMDSRALNSIKSLKYMVSIPVQTQSMAHQHNMHVLLFCVGP